MFYSTVLTLLVVLLATILLAILSMLLVYYSTALANTLLHAYILIGCHLCYTQYCIYFACMLLGYYCAQYYVRSTMYYPTLILYAGWILYYSLDST